MTELTPKQLLPSIPMPIGAVIRDPDQEVVPEDSENQRESSQDTGTEERMPQHSFAGLLKSIVKSNYKALPRRLVKDIVWIGPLAAIWIGLWSMSAMTLMTLPGPVRGLAWLAIFLTATYNGFIAKAAYITVMSRTFVPMIRQIRAGESSDIKSRYSRTLAMIRGVIISGKRQSAKILLASAGLGLIASNILTRNNKIDKYLICVLCAVALIDDLSKGQGSAVVRLTAAALRDLPVMMGQRFRVTMKSTYVSIAGFAVGLLLAIVPGQFVNSFNSPAGAIAGAILVVAGLALQLTEGGHAKKTV